VGETVGHTIIQGIGGRLPITGVEADHSVHGPNERRAASLEHFAGEPLELIGAALFDHQTPAPGPREDLRGGQELRGGDHLPQVVRRSELFLRIGFATKGRERGSVVKGEVGQARLAQISYECFVAHQGPFGLVNVRPFQGRFEAEAQGPTGEDRVAQALGDCQELAGGVEPLLDVGGISDRVIAGEQDLGQHCWIVEVAGDPERLIGQSYPARGVGLPRQFETERREETSPHRQVFIAHRSDGGFEDLYAVLVDAEGSPDVPERVGQRRSGQSRGISELGSQPCRVEQGLAVAGITGAAFGLAAADEQLQAARVPGLGLAGVEELQAGHVIPGGLVVCQLGQGPVTGSSGIHDRSCDIPNRSAGFRPVVGQSGNEVVEGAGVDRLDRLGGLAVEDDLAGGGERVVERGSDQGVGEAEAPGRDLDYNPGIRCLFDGGEEVVLAQVSGRLDDIEFELRADDGCDAQRLVGIAG
jgi:hypothetical protein